MSLENYINNMSEAEILHDQQVKTLASRLKAKGRYFAVGTEVSLWRDDMTGEKGRADVLTIDPQNNRIIYWEVKTGKVSKSMKKSRKQAETFYAHMRTKPAYDSWDSKFVYYNPIKEVIKRL